MSKRRRTKKRRSAAQRAATARMLAANGRKGKRHMAKRRRKRSSAPRRRRTSRRHHSGGRRVHHRRRRRGFGGGGGGIIAQVKHDAPRMIIGALYGLAEKTAAGDAAFIMNKIPKPIPKVGYTGNVAAALYVAGMFVKHPYVRLAAGVVATIAMYKMGKAGGTIADSTTIGSSPYGADDEISGDERIIDANVMGALDAEAQEFSTQKQGLSYDDAVREARSQV